MQQQIIFRKLILLFCLLPERRRNRVIQFASLYLQISDCSVMGSIAFLDEFRNSFLHIIGDELLNCMLSIWVIHNCCEVALWGLLTLDSELWEELSNISNRLLDYSVSENELLMGLPILVVVVHRDVLYLLQGDCVWILRLNRCRLWKRKAMLRNITNSLSDILELSRVLRVIDFNIRSVRKRVFSRHFNGLFWIKSLFSFFLIQEIINYLHANN